MKMPATMPPPLPHVPDKASVFLPSSALTIGPAFALGLFLCLSPAIAQHVPQPTDTATITAEKTSEKGTKAQQQTSKWRDWSDEIIYFVIPDRFADGNKDNNKRRQKRNPGGWHGGDLAGLKANLGEIADLGATAIWITPVYLQIPKPMAASLPNRDFQHWGFHGYWADDFTKMEPRLGTEADLKALVDAAHKRGIKVLLDVVYNHSGYGSTYTHKHSSWIRQQNVGCEVDPLNCHVGGLPDFRTELPEVRSHLLEANISLAERTDIDGFRLDTVKHIKHEFWRAHRTEANKRLGNDFFLLGEVWGGSPQTMDDYYKADEVDAGFDFTFRGACRDFVLGRGRTVAFNAYLKKRHRLRKGYHMAHYLSSHDEPTLLSELNHDKRRFKLCAALQMTTQGIPVIYYGEEVGRKGGAWPYNRDDMPWGDKDISPGTGKARDEALRDFYKKLIAVRKSSPALVRGSYTPLHTQGDILVYAKHDQESGDIAIVAINRAKNRGNATLTKPDAWTSMRAHDVISGATIPFDGKSLTLTLPPLSAMVLKPE